MIVKIRLAHVARYDYFWDPMSVKETWPQRRGLGGEQTGTKKTIETVLSDYRWKKIYLIFPPVGLQGQPEPATWPMAKTLGFSGWRWFPNSRVRVRLHAKHQCTISPGTGKAESVRQRP